MMISFDIIAGRTKRAPVWMQKSGLEWCYRLATEPKKTWKRYATTNPVFMWMVIKEYVKRRAHSAWRRVHSAESKGQRDPVE